MRRAAEWRFGRHSPQRQGGTGPARRRGMIDLLYILSTVAFFALAWGYALLCEKL